MQFVDNIKKSSGADIISDLIEISHNLKDKYFKLRFNIIDNSFQYEIEIYINNSWLVDPVSGERIYLQEDVDDYIRDYESKMSSFECEIIKEKPIKPTFKESIGEYDFYVKKSESSFCSVLELLSSVFKKMIQLQVK